MKRLPLVLISLMLGIFFGSYFSGAILQGRGDGAPALPRELTSYRDVVKRVLPAVVSIESKSRAARPKRRAPDSSASEDRRPYSQDLWLPEPDESANFGSGVLVDPKGVVLTNYHIVE